MAVADGLAEFLEFFAVDSEKLGLVEKCDRADCETLDPVGKEESARDIVRGGSVLLPGGVVGDGDPAIDIVLVDLRTFGEEELGKLGAELFDESSQTSAAFLGGIVGQVASRDSPKPVGPLLPDDQHPAVLRIGDSMESIHPVLADVRHHLLGRELERPEHAFADRLEVRKVL